MMGTRCACCTDNSSLNGFREFDLHHGSFSNPALHSDVSSVGIDQRLHHGQTDTAAAGLPLRDLSVR